MKLSKNLINEFVKMTNDRTKESPETTVYGNIIKNGDRVYVQLDGSDTLTPVSTTTDTQPGDRVVVLIKNHTATVTGNMTSPAARTSDVQEINERKLDEPSADLKYATIANLEATNASINNLEAAHASFETITAGRFKGISISLENLEATTGTSGIWKYRKWSNGRIELWGSYSVSGVTCSNQMGSAMYKSETLSMPSFPFSIYEPNLTASYESDGYGAFLWATSTTTETSPPSYYLVRPESGTITSGKINFHVIGKWTE